MRHSIVLHMVDSIKQSEVCAEEVDSKKDEKK